MINNINNPICYQDRMDLSRMEILGINHYKDLVNPQFAWDYELCDKIFTGVDCHVVNSVLRGKLSYSDLSRADKIRFTRIEKYVKSAVEKSAVSSSFDIIKGIRDFPELVDYNKDNVVSDGAFCSFTTSISKASEYAGKNSADELIYFVLRLNKGDNALYVDDNEDEWIIQENTKYAIFDVVHYALSEWVRGNKAIVYYLRIV